MRRAKLLVELDDNPEADEDVILILHLKIIMNINFVISYRFQVQGGPSASGKGYVDSKFEVAFGCKFIL